MTDPTELAARFANEDSMAFLDSIFEEPSEEDMGLIDRVRDTIDDLPDREADFVELYYFRGKRQTDIARIFRVSQPTVSYRLGRAAKRILFLLELPNVDFSQLERDMKSFLDDPLDAEIMVLMYQTTCQSEVAKRLGVSQGLVRHRFMRSLRKMVDDPRMILYVRLFDTISENLNILREVQRPRQDTQIRCVVG
jgi:DNA-directed RNA polymerase specialized sigma24 family protein